MVLAGERVAERKVWLKVVCRFFVVSEVTERLVRIKSILDDWDTIPFLNYVCSSLLDFLARSIKWCLSIMEWRANEVTFLRISRLLESSGSRIALKSPAARTYPSTTVLDFLIS